MQVISTEKVSKDFIHLNSCGIEKLWDRDWVTVRENGRVDYHIIYILNGKCVTETNGNETVLNEGNMVLFLPGEKQKYIFKKEDKPISCYLHFSGTGCDKILKNLGFMENRVLRMPRSQAIETAFKKLSDEYYLKKPFYEEMCNAYLLELFAIIGRKISYTDKKAYVSHKAEIDEVCRQIIDEYTISRPVEYYASKCHLSVSRFHYVFKEATGFSPVEYINKVRIERAEDLLNNTNLTISEISDMVGFSDPNYFRRIFKKYTRISPKKLVCKK